MVATHVFAGIPIADLDASMSWYEWLAGATRSDPQ
jgi:hypothetical protein